MLPCRRDALLSHTPPDLWLGTGHQGDLHRKAAKMSHTGTNTMLVVHSVLADSHPGAETSQINPLVDSCGRTQVFCSAPSSHWK